MLITAHKHISFQLSENEYYCEGLRSLYHAHSARENINDLQDNINSTRINGIPTCTIFFSFFYHLFAYIYSHQSVDLAGNFPI